MNWLDFVIIFVLALFALEGLRRTFLEETTELVSFLLAFFLSLKYYNLAASLLEKQFPLPHSFANALGFLVVWYLTEIIFLLIIKNFLSKFVNRSYFYSIDRVLSVIPSFFRGFVFIAVILVLLTAFPVQPMVKRSVKESRISQAILNQTYQLEGPLKNVFGGLANDTLAFLTIKPQSRERLGLGFQTNDFTFSEALEAEMVELVNGERKKEGRNVLSYDPILKEAGRVHSTDMFKKGYFSHYNPEGENVADRADKLGVGFMVIGENLAFAPSLELAHKGLMNSQGHRENILSKDYNKIGIAVADGGDNGLMITQVFSN